MSLKGVMENGFVWILTTGFLVLWVGSPFWLGWAYSSADGSGWAPHSHDTPVWIGGDWMTGEYRICDMPGNLWGRIPKSAHLLCSSGDPRAAQGVMPSEFHDELSSQEIEQLNNGSWAGLESHFHVLSIKYWGRIDRRDRYIFVWRCQRISNGLVCYAIN